jgi:hypothetical protein
MDTKVDASLVRIGPRVKTEHKHRTVVTSGAHIQN